MKKNNQTILAILALLLVPSSVFASENFSEFVKNAVGVINIVIQFIVGITFFVLIFGIFKYVSTGRGNEEAVKKTKDLVVYGIVAIFIMLSVWGFVTILSATFFPDSDIDLIDCGTPCDQQMQNNQFQNLG